MSNETLVEALRRKIIEWRESALAGYMTGNQLIDERTAAYSAQWHAHADEVEAILQAHAAEAAQVNEPELFDQWMDRDWPLWRNDPNNPNVARLRRMFDTLAAAPQPQAAEPVAWPFVESPGEIADRLKDALENGCPLLGAVRQFFIERCAATPPISTNCKKRLSERKAC